MKISLLLHESMLKKIDELRGISNRTTWLKSAIMEKIIRTEQTLKKGANHIK